MDLFGEEIPPGGDAMDGTFIPPRQGLMDGTLFSDVSSNPQGDETSTIENHLAEQLEEKAATTSNAPDHNILQPEDYGQAIDMAAKVNHVINGVVENGVPPMPVNGCTKCDLMTIQPNWLLIQKLNALTAENKILKEMLWTKHKGTDTHEANELQTFEAFSVAQDIIGELITKSVFLSETQASAGEVSHYLQTSSSLAKPTQRKRGRPPKKKPEIANGTLPCPEDKGNLTLENDKPAKRKNPHPRKCTLKETNIKPYQNMSDNSPLPPRRQKVLAQTRSAKGLKEETEEDAGMGYQDNAVTPNTESHDSGGDGHVDDDDDDVYITNGAIETAEIDELQPIDARKSLKRNLRKKTVNRVSSIFRKKHKKIVRHRCKLCGTTFTHGRPFKRHISGYPRGSCCCKLCHKEFISAAIFLHHECEAKRKVKGAQRSCKHCGEIFTNIKKYVAHLKDVHQDRGGEPECFCKYCKKGFIKRATMYKHYNDHAPSGQKACNKCGEFVVDSEDSWNEHSRFHMENAKHICGKCGATFMRKQQYEQHMAAHEKYGCSICNGCYSTRKALEKHQRVTHGIRIDYDQKKYYCDQCGKCFARPGLLEIHTRVHTGEKPIECMTCHMFFRTPKALNKHKQTYTHMARSGDIKKERDHLCQICGKAYFRKQALQRHMRYHTGEKPYKCPHCDYICRENNNLKRHIALHFSQRDYVCETCGAAFHAKKTLETHRVYKHSDTRNFHCEECPMSFKTPNSLRRHMRIHANTRPHKCDWCGTGFNRLYNLRRHLRSVHGNDEGLPAPKRVKLLDVPAGLEFHKGSQAASTGQSPPEPAPVAKKRTKREKTQPIIEESSALAVPLPTTSVFDIDENQVIRTTEPLAPAPPELLTTNVLQAKPIICADTSLTNLSVAPAPNLNPQVINQIVSNTVSMMQGYYQETDGTLRSYTVAAPVTEANQASTNVITNRTFPVTTDDVINQVTTNQVVAPEQRQDQFQESYCAVTNYLHFMQNNT